MSDQGQKPSEFERATAGNRDVGIVQEFWQFLRHNKKWWLAPIVVVVLLLGTLIALSGSAAAPFIYTLF
jgi:hypothetical protein